MPYPNFAGKHDHPVLTEPASFVRYWVEHGVLPADARALNVTEDGSYQPQLSQVDGRPLTVVEAVLEHLHLRDTHQQAAGLLQEALAVATA